MTSKQKDNLLLENLYFNAVVEAAKKCPECGCNPTHPKDECECDHDCDEPVEEAKKGSKPDYMDVDGDGDKKEPMKKALKEKGKNPFAKKKKK